MFFFSDELICWTFRASGAGGKGVNYQIFSDNNTLVEVMTLQEVGWVGAGSAKGCIEGSDWDRLSSGHYRFHVEGTSVLFGTTTTTSYSFILSSPLN